jgi:hypothetical protein
MTSVLVFLRSAAGRYLASRIPRKPGGAGVEPSHCEQLSRPALCAHQPNEGRRHAVDAGRSDQV